MMVKMLKMMRLIRMMMLSSFDYVEIGFLSFSTDLMGKWVVAVFLLTLQTICLSPPLLVFVGFNFFHLCLFIVFLYFLLLFVLHLGVNAGISLDPSYIY